VFGGGCHEDFPGFRFYNFVPEFQLAAADILDPTPDCDRLIIVGRFFETNLQVGYGQDQPILLELGVGMTVAAHPVAAPLFKPDHIRSVMDDAHLVGFSVTDAERSF
jgi:hypothetical protein